MWRLTEADRWRAMAGPWARATLPDDQALDVVVVERVRAADGTWWYEADAILPARHQEPDGSTRPVGAPTRISVPAERICPIPGEVYDAVPTRGAVAGRQWRVEACRRQGPPPYARLHRARECWQATGELITTTEAAQLVADGLVRQCDVCRPDPSAEQHD
ncbi:DUF6233 domain-containing protein [Streptomyces buecherae]|uniref:DUF6233 domain-containing protein n=1 Tax=Streptomyces buecherae TaxID=2763006 RepID=UPI00365F0E7A